MSTKKRRSLKLVVCGSLSLIAFPIFVQATPIVGSTNEVINGDFEQGTVLNPPPSWMVTDRQVITAGVGNPGQSAQCFIPTGTGNWGDTMRQVVDESLNPLWNPLDDSKIIDLQADINTNVNIPINGIRFRLDFWSDAFNSVNDPTTLPAPTSVTDWVQYTGTDFNADPTKWNTVNPFNRLALDFQPRWASVEIQFMQPAPADIIRVDNVILTSECIPEPSTILLVACGAGFAVLRFRARCS